MSDYETINEHTSGIREPENEKATAAGLTATPCKVVQETQTYSAIADLKMGETEKTALKNSKNKRTTKDTRTHPIKKKSWNPISIWSIWK